MANSVATVAVLEGQAWAKAPDGTLRPLKIGDTVTAEETVITATGARIELDFGDGQPVVIAGNQEVLMNRDLWTDLASDKQDAAIDSASVEEALTVLNEGGDLTTELEETAAGLGGGGTNEGHDFVALTRVIEETDPLAFNYDINNPETEPTTEFFSTGTAGNLSPEVTGQSFVGDEDSAISGQIAANDPENGGLTYSLVGQPSNGAITLNPATGVFVYTPNTNYSGPDSFIVTVTDSAGNATNTTVSLSVTAINDAPVAESQTLSTAEDTPVTGQVVASDVEGNTLTYTVSSVAANGTVTINAATGAFVYTPNANYSGLDSFVVTIADGNGGVTTSTINVGVTGINDAPVANADLASTPFNQSVTVDVLANDLDVDNAKSSLVVSNPTVDPAQGTAVVNAQGQVVFTPATNFSGPATITYTITDPAGLTSTGTLTVNVSANTPPTSADKAVSITEDGQYTFSSNDFAFADDDAGQTLSAIRIDSLPAAGSLSLNGTAVTVGQVINAADVGGLVFTPAANGNGANYANFTFSVQDSIGGFAASSNTISVSVTPVNDAAVVSSADVTLNETNAPLTTSGTLTSSDVDNAANAFTPSTTVGTTGTLSINAAGAWTYTANSAFDNLNVGQSVNETFTVASVDGTTSTIKITINGTNDAATVSSADVTLTETNAPLTTSGTLTSADVDNAANTFTPSTTVGTTGTLSINAAGAWTYTANSAFDNLNVGQSVNETFTVASVDGTTSTIKITITGTNDLPVAQSSTFIVAEDAAVVNGSVVSTDVDANATATYSLNGAAPAGLTFNANGTYSFNAGNAAYQSLGVGQSTVLTVPYTVTDDAGATSTANLVITVTGTNDAPVAQASSFSVAEDAAVVNGSVSSTDVDANATATYSLNGAA
ncbi:MAG: retention module-containing protein, partial [Cellvibrio sp.]